MKDISKEQVETPKDEEAKRAASTEAKWEESSDSFLRSIITMTGIKDWERVSHMMCAQFVGKTWTGTDCKERWYSALEPMLSRKPWTEQEELEMIVAHKMCQNKWSSVSALLQGRNNNTIKNRFYSVFRKVKNKVKRNETIFNSRIELLEILYMMTQMEQHLSQPFPPIPHKGKRGKDFVYTLLQNLHIEELEKFRLNLARTSRQPETLQSLWDELAAPIERAKNELSERINALAGKNTYVPLDQFVAHVENGLYPGTVSAQQKYVLPRPETFRPATALDEEGKLFAVMQAFAARSPRSSFMSPREVASTGTHMCCLPTPELISVPPFSAGPFQFGPPVFQGFSDYTTLARKAVVPMQMQNMMPLSPYPPMSQMQMVNGQGIAVYSPCMQGPMLPYPVMRPPIVLPQVMHPAPSMIMYRPPMQHY